jgi:hypothetical protein
MANPDPLLDHLSKVMTDFEAAQKALLEVLEPIAFGATRGDLKTKLGCYVRLDALLDLCKSVTTAANTHMPTLADKVTTEMLASDMDSIEMFGHKFTPATKTYVSVNSENKPLVIDWLKQHPVGVELVKEDFNANAFTSLIKKLVEEDGYSKDATEKEKRIPAQISMFDKPTLSMRKVKGK